MATGDVPAPLDLGADLLLVDPFSQGCGELGLSVGIRREHPCVLVGDVDADDEPLPLHVSADEVR